VEFFGGSDDGAGARDGAEFGEEGGVHVRLWKGYYGGEWMGSHEWWALCDFSTCRDLCDSRTGVSARLQWRISGKAMNSQVFPEV